MFYVSLDTVLPILLLILFHANSCLCFKGFITTFKKKIQTLSREPTAWEEKKKKQPKHV